MELPSPASLRQLFPLSSFAQKQRDLFRQSACEILQGKSSRLVFIVGPCSIHDPKSALEYAQKLQSLSQELSSSFLLILRFFIEKPRTRLGWKGMLYDPFLDGSHDIEEGLKQSRQLLVQIVEMGVPCAMEILEPLALPYFEDLLTWGLIGARTSASQPHRQIASQLSFPVGFKNDCFGRWDAAIDGIYSSQMPHCFIGLNETGKVAKIQTQGNPFSHLVLRGKEEGPNYDTQTVKKALSDLRRHHLHPRLLIDCSHGNSGKDPFRQRQVLEEVLAHRMEGVVGFMLESHLLSGRQPLPEDLTRLHYGVSITDACLGWEETSSLLRWGAERSMSMHCVQK